MASTTTQPNILLLICDHLSPRVMGCYGDRHGSSPTMDSIASAGVRFERAYAACPLCQPSRASFWTGRYPHQTGVLSNGNPAIHPRGEAPIPEDMPTVGTCMAGVGYKTIHFGKRHDAGGLQGFELAEVGKIEVAPEHPAWPVNGDTFQDRNATEQCVRWLGEWQGENQPYLAVADLNNPHNICGWIGENQGPHEDHPIPGDLPPLPANFEIDDLENRPAPIRYLCCGHNRLGQAARWNETNYRHYIAAFHHYTRLVDREIERILAAARQRRDWDNTVVILISDHGDGLASHRMVTKQVTFYEELMQVPMLFTGPGISGRGRALTEPLVSLLDLLPTLCELGGATPPPDVPGRSLMPWLRGEAPSEWRGYLAGEWHTEWGYSISPGRMIRTDRYKYTHYLEEEGEELYDLMADPDETRTLHLDPAYHEQLERHRALLQQHVQATDDPYFDHEVLVPSQWRNHPLGYMHHKGGLAERLRVAPHSRSRQV